jgi:hypothetical protein
VKLALRLVIALIIGITMFFVCMILPVFVISVVRGDPGNIAGGLLTISIGAPLGLVGGVFFGILSFRKIEF